MSTVWSPSAQTAIYSHRSIKNTWCREENPGGAVKILAYVMDPLFHLHVPVNERFLNILYFTW